MNRIHSRLVLSVRGDIIPGQDDERNIGSFEHLPQYIANPMTRAGTYFICFDFESMLILKIVFEQAPLVVIPMPNKNPRALRNRRWFKWALNLGMLQVFLEYVEHTLDCDSFGGFNFDGH